MATDTMAEFMGVRVDPLDEAVKADTSCCASPFAVGGTVGGTAGTFVLDGRLNDAFHAVNLLLDKGVAVRRVDAAASGLRPGDFLVAPAARRPCSRDVARQTGVDFTGAEGRTRRRAFTT